MKGQNKGTREHLLTLLQLPYFCSVMALDTAGNMLFEPRWDKTGNAVLVFQDQEEDSLGSTRLCLDNFPGRDLCLSCMRANSLDWLMSYRSQ